MKRKITIVMLVGLIASLSLAACAEPVNPYWLRIRDGFPNQATVLEQVYEKEDDTVYIRASIPRIWGVGNLEWQDRVNREIAEGVNAFVDDIVDSAAEAKAMFEQEEWDHFIPYVGQVDYDVKLNWGGLLSLTLTFYQYTGGAHGMTHVEVLNFDLTTGYSLEFDDLFPTDSDKEMVVAVINEQISQSPEWFFIPEFDQSMFQPEQSFYLQEGEVVTYFSLYEISPYAAGIPEFTISVP